MSTLSVMFAVTFLVAGASQPVVKFVSAPDAEFASEMVLSSGYGEIVDVTEIPVPADDDFANGFFDIEPREYAVYPLSDTLPDTVSIPSGRLMVYKDRIVEITDTYPDGSVGVVDTFTDEFLVVNALLLEEHR